MVVQIKNKLQIATLCYVRHGGKTLMLCKDRDSDSIHFGKFNGLGGKKNNLETPLECVIREVFEESGLIIKDPFLHGNLDFPGFTKGYDWSVYVYSVSDFKGDLAESLEGSLHWIPDNEIRSLNLWDGDREFIPLILQGEKFSGTFYYQDKNLKSFKLDKEETNSI